ncbi:hypothetical protein EIN_152830 [Entamoeba invadens IP1]|uniref:Uncharacterized protein n=1 Tax=Entamoeba invadens IP1 TaxID=370355 RepID=A0A0A1UEM8_ENTIV|nr:hypothetical protein EIN_152830 [Entamoeba invadens IP1]ELP91286.1 hypothetical protein EIN_152830 [Entamoeba invadens IP1]|eukprot:XP_004258057.1 hypothetical protein EIN_152830 [Entamoeba invadens IP1]
MDPTEALLVEVHNLQEELSFLRKKVETVQLDNYDARLTTIQIEMSKKTKDYEELEAKFVQALNRQSVLAQEKLLFESKEQNLIVEYKTKLQDLQNYCDHLKHKRNKKHSKEKKSLFQKVLDVTEGPKNKVEKVEKHVEKVKEKNEKFEKTTKVPLVVPKNVTPPVSQNESIKQSDQIKSETPNLASTNPFADLTVEPQIKQNQELPAVLQTDLKKSETKQDGIGPNLASTNPFADTNGFTQVEPLKEQLPKLDVAPQYSLNPFSDTQNLPQTTESGVDIQKEIKHARQSETPNMNSTNPFADVTVAQDKSAPKFENLENTNPFAEPNISSSTPIDSSHQKKESKDSVVTTNLVTDQSLVSKSTPLTPIEKVGTPKKSRTPDKSPSKLLKAKKSVVVLKETTLVKSEIIGPSQNEIVEQMPVLKSFPVEKPQVVIHNEFEDFQVSSSSSSSSSSSDSEDTPTFNIEKLSSDNIELKKETVELKKKIEECEKKYLDYSNVMSKALDDKTLIVQTLQSRIFELENEKKALEFKHHQLENRIEEYTKSTSDEVEDNNMYLLVNGICVSLKLANPDFEDTTLSVATLNQKVKERKIPMCQWPLFIYNEFENEVGKSKV